MYLQIEKHTVNAQSGKTFFVISKNNWEKKSLLPRKALHF